MMQTVRVHGTYILSFLSPCFLSKIKNCVSILSKGFSEAKKFDIPQTNNTDGFVFHGFLFLLSISVRFQILNLSPQNEHHL